MPLPKLFTTNRARDKQNELNSIVKGYPLTNTPVVHDILKHQVDFKHINLSKNIQKVGLTLAQEGSDLVKPESIEVMRKKIQVWYPKVAGFTEQFDAPLPSNAIAISVAHVNFEVGDSCHEFRLCKAYKEAPNSYYTYRKMSECIQCCYYNEGGQEFFAGQIFYPTPHGSSKLLQFNNALLSLSSSSAITYPLKDRNKSSGMVQYQNYGRFCASAGRHVLVQLAKCNGVPYHNEFDHIAKKWKYVTCKECMQDYFTYKWVEPKKDLPAAKVVPAALQESPATPAPVTNLASTLAEAPGTSSESSAVSFSGSTESLFEEFDKIDVKGSGDDGDSDIDAELID